MADSAIRGRKFFARAVRITINERSNNDPNPSRPLHKLLLIPNESGSLKGMRIWVSKGALVFLLIAVLIWSGAGWVQATGNQSVNYKLVPNLEPMKDNSLTPDFALVNPAGKKISLKDFRGKVVLLNFWASWCVPCREEMPAMERLYEEFKGKDFVVVGVNVKEQNAKALEFTKERKITYPVLLDNRGDVGLLYGAWGLPTTYLIGRNGEGLARMWGPADWYGSGARELIRTLLADKG